MLVISGVAFNVNTKTSQHLKCEDGRYIYDVFRLLDTSNWYVMIASRHTGEYAYDGRLPDSSDKTQDDMMYNAVTITHGALACN